MQRGLQQLQLSLMHEAMLGGYRTSVVTNAEVFSSAHHD